MRDQFTEFERPNIYSSKILMSSDSEPIVEDIIYNIFLLLSLQDLVHYASCSKSHYETYLLYCDDDEFWSDRIEIQYPDLYHMFPLEDDLFHDMIEDAIKNNDQMKKLGISKLKIYRYRTCSLSLPISALHNMWFDDFTRGKIVRYPTCEEESEDAKIRLPNYHQSLVERIRDDLRSDAYKEYLLGTVRNYIRCSKSRDMDVLQKLKEELSRKRKQEYDILFDNCSYNDLVELMSKTNLSINILDEKINKLNFHLKYQYYTLLEYNDISNEITSLSEEKQKLSDLKHKIKNNITYCLGSLTEDEIRAKIKSLEDAGVEYISYSDYSSEDESSETSEEETNLIEKYADELLQAEYNKCTGKTITEFIRDKDKEHEGKNIIQNAIKISERMYMIEVLYVIYQQVDSLGFRMEDLSLNPMSWGISPDELIIALLYPSANGKLELFELRSYHGLKSDIVEKAIQLEIARREKKKAYKKPTVPAPYKSNK